MPGTLTALAIRELLRLGSAVQPVADHAVDRGADVATVPVEELGVDAQGRAFVKRFLLLYSGPPTPPGRLARAMAGVVTKIGDALVDVGSPMTNGFVLRGDRSTSDDAAT